MERVAAASPVWNATLRTTCVATQLEGGHAMNALPQLAAATVNCRVLPEDSIEYVQSTLEKVLADYRGEAIKIIGDVHRGPASPLRPDILKTIGSVTDTLWPGVAVSPLWFAGATDGSICAPSAFPLTESKDFSWTATISACMGAMSVLPCNPSTKARRSCMSW